MNFLIDGQPRTLSPLKDFRAQHGLPPEFKVSLFEPKDYAGLGNIERAGADLNAVRHLVLASIPPHVTQATLFSDALPRLERVFEQQLYAINPVVGLKDVEIGFAVSGFADVCRAWGYAFVRARIDKTPLPDFNHIYADWLYSSIRVSQTLHPYAHQGQTWQIQVLTHAYGRFGLVVHSGQAAHYVYDAALACPAEGYMLTLLSEVVQTFATRLS
jgi:hypothetical protein